MTLIDPAPSMGVVSVAFFTPHLWELAMKSDKEIVRIELTPEQKQLIKKQTGKDAEAVELSVKELEERIAPMYFQ